MAPVANLKYHRMSTMLCRLWCEGKSLAYSATHNESCMCYNEEDSKFNFISASCWWGVMGQHICLILVGSHSIELGVFVNSLHSKGEACVIMAYF